MKKITAVLPTIGRINYLDIAIESMLVQNISFDEIIVFDNSIEQNLQELSNYGSNKLVTFIKSGKQLNAIDSWNTAVESAKNDYVTIMGDDDILLPNYCENIHNLLKLSDIGILKAYSINENGVKKGTLIYPEKEILTDKEFRTSRFFNKLSLFVPGMVFKKELFLEIGGFKNTYIDGLAYADELLLSQLSALAGSISISKDFCWNYRIHSGQIAGVKDISTYVDRVMKYLELYEESLKLLDINIDELYPQFTKQDYIDKACRYGVKLYGTYASSNENIFIFLLNLIRYFIFDKRVSFKSRIKTTLSSVKAFIGSTNIGKTIKRIKNK
jgi:glycosyltransferase involved in cell wall biosynthesis